MAIGLLSVVVGGVAGGVLSGPRGGLELEAVNEAGWTSFPDWRSRATGFRMTRGRCHTLNQLWETGAGHGIGILRRQPRVVWKRKTEGSDCGGRIRAADEEVGILASTDPFEILGLPEECSVEDVKSAFRAKVREYHPDVYEGKFDANALSQQLIKAYKALLGELEGADFQRLRETNPFKEPEGPATCLFVNQLRCIGKGCRYSCVERAERAFKFSEETGRARASDVADVDDYNVQLAVGQCPELCIHIVTPRQKSVLESLLGSVINGVASPAEAGLELDGLLAKACFENGRERRSKRVVKRSEKYVDWF
ncbi:hypothetical protein CBR_g31147 [Chara braunii]|uniref:J domain-containing protein n=1 Tax=Chara braunii TaxID=69332 RepID=A0A388LEG0_CHABU|nr:hypothetical protein CBR_g31147 [Chara braunii]|eukprot:GBG80688.1 hypothetical protein CBR_g31147 [Chara braunii]